MQRCKNLCECGEINIFVLHLSVFPKSSFEMVPHTPVLPSGKLKSCLELQNLSEFWTKRGGKAFPDDVHYPEKRCFGENTHPQGFLPLVFISNCWFLYLGGITSSLRRDVGLDTTEAYTYFYKCTEAVRHELQYLDKSCQDYHEFN